MPTTLRRNKGGAIPAAEWDVERVVAELRRLGTKHNVEGMAHYGIRAKKVFGVSKPKLDAFAKKIGKNHALGLRLWSTGIQDAKILAGMICEPGKVTAAQMELWVRDFDNWDSCDGTCCHLFVFADAAWQKAFAWTKRENEFQKRGGLGLAAVLSDRDKAAEDPQDSVFL